MDEHPLVRASRQAETAQKWATRLAWMELLPYLVGGLFIVLGLCTCGVYLVMGW